MFLAYPPDMKPLQPLTALTLSGGHCLLPLASGLREQLKAVVGSNTTKKTCLFSGSNYKVLL